MPRPRFLLDAHLKPLAFWLRWLGYDTVQIPRSPASLTQARKIVGRRIYVTTSPKAYALAVKAKKGTILLPLNAPTLKQLGLLLNYLNLNPTLRFDRCPLCNTPLRPLPKERIPRETPNRVKDTVQQFWHCYSCSKVYWEGNHVERIRNCFRLYVEKRE